MSNNPTEAANAVSKIFATRFLVICTFIHSPDGPEYPCH
jgi:hypothetical protein